MRPVIALLILGSIVTSASAAGTDIRGLVEHAFNNGSQPPSQSSSHHKTYQ